MTAQFSSADKIALVCPGHGPQTPVMFDDVKAAETFRKYAPLVSEIAGEDVFARLTPGDAGIEYVRRNEIASLLMALASVVRFARVRDEGVPFQYTAGYSVGQWTAMHLASMLDADTLFRIIWQRAMFMNQAASGGAMLAVIGLSAEQVETICSEIRSTGA